MNEAADLRLRPLMHSNEGWGRTAGREVYQALVDFVESKAGKLIFRISISGVKRLTSPSLQKRSSNSRDAIGVRRAFVLLIWTT